MVIYCRVKGRYLSWESALLLAPCVCIMWAITSLQVMVNSICSLVSFCGVVDSCGEIIICVVYVVSCVSMKINIFCDVAPSAVVEVYRQL
jgi:hypothetical protein